MGGNEIHDALEMSIEYTLVCSFVGRGIVVCVGYYYFVCFLSLFIFPLSDLCWHVTELYILNKEDGGTR